MTHTFTQRRFEAILSAIPEATEASLQISLSSRQIHTSGLNPGWFMADSFGEGTTLPSKCRLICFEDFEVDLKTRELRKAGTPLLLHRQSFQVLLALLQAQGGLVTKDELREALWPSYTLLDFDRSINKSISKLRLALQDSTEAPRFVETVRDQGYRFLVPVRFVPEENAQHTELAGTAAAVNEDAHNRAPEAARLAGFGPYEFDLKALDLRKRGTPVRLHPQSLKLLDLLLKHAGQMLTREELYKQLWPEGTYVDFESSLKKAVSKLRIALDDSADQPSYIETLPGRGYRFIAPIRYIEPDRGADVKSAKAQAATDHENEGTTDQAQGTDSPTKSRLRPRIMYAFAITATFTLFGFGIYALWHSLSHSRAVRPTIAVLEFKNLSGQASEAWLATALSEWTATELSAGGELRLIPGDQVMQMQLETATPNPGNPTPDRLSQIRRILGTDFVVTGSYEVFGTADDPRIKVDLQLSDARSGNVLKTISQTARESDLFNLISQTGQSLRSRLGIHKAIHKTPQQAAAGLPSNPDAMKLYSNGLHKLRMGDALSARDLLEKAAEAEPYDPNIHDRLAAAWAALGYDFNAKAEAQKAMDLSVNLPREDHLTIEGRYEELSTNWNQAIEIYHSLFEFYPDNPEYGLALAKAQTSAAKPKDALATIASMRRIPSLNNDPRIDIAEARAELHSGNAKQALAASEKASRKAEAAGASLLVAKAELEEGAAYMVLEAFDKSIAPLSDAKSRYAAAGVEMGVADASKSQGIAYNYSGDYSRSQSAYEEALAISRRIGSQKGITSNLLALGDIRLDVGDPWGAKTRFTEATSIAQAIHDDDDLALAHYYLGRALIDLASPAGARESLQQALEIFQRIGRQDRAAMTFGFLAETWQFEANFDAALAAVAQELEIYKKMDYKEGIGWGEIVRADILLDQEHSDEATTTANDAAANLGAVKDIPGQEMALAFVARALLQQGKANDAKRTIQEARALWKNNNDPEVDIVLTLCEIRLHALSPVQSQRNEAERQMRDLINKATNMGRLPFALQLRFDLAEIEVKNNKKDLARGQLKALIKEANEKDIGLIAKKAAKLLKSKPLSQS